MREKVLVSMVHSYNHESAELANKYDIYDIVNAFIKLIETYIVLAQRSATNLATFFS